MSRSLVLPLVMGLRYRSTYQCLRDVTDRAIEDAIAEYPQDRRHHKVVDF